MKSFFSCIPRKKIKSKNCVNHQLEDSKKLANNVNNSNSESHIDKTDSRPVEHVNHTDKDSALVKQAVDEEQEIIKQQAVKERQQAEEMLKLQLEADRKLAEDRANAAKEKLLYTRLNYALLRIENVSRVLEGKCPGYRLAEVILQFDALFAAELQQFLAESAGACVAIQSQSELVCQLFLCHRAVLVMVQERAFDALRRCSDEMRALAVAINAVCQRDDHSRELSRLVADSILIFGWVCVLDRPAQFVQHNLDGYLINVTRLLNDRRLVNYINWLKCWAVFLKRFSVIITQNFRAALMWGLDGPVPLDILQCLIESNYSRFEDPSTRIDVRKPKEKVIKTTTVDKMSCEAMTSLMDDLRSGRHKTRLRSTKTEVDSQVDEKPQEQLTNGHIEPLTHEDSDCGEVVKKVDYQPHSNMWIIENVRDETDIEVPNKGPGNSVLIRNCQNCSIQIEGTLGAIKLDRSSLINLIIDDVTGRFELVDCSGIESQVFGNVADIRLDNVSQFKIFVPLNCAKSIELVSSRSSEVELYVSKSEEGGLELNDYDKFPIAMNCRSTISGSHISSELF